MVSALFRLRRKMTQRGRPIYKLTPEQQETAVTTYEEKGTLKAAAKAIEISRASLYNAIKADKKFAAKMEQAKETYRDGIRDLIHSMVKGEVDFKAPRGLMTMFHAKAHMPEYREQVTQKHEGTIKVITGIPRPKKKDKKDVS